jgi:serine/threonine-protein kinase
MEATRWERVQTLFHEALELPPVERTAFLDGACTDDPSLATEVRELLAEDEAGDSVLDAGVASVAQHVLDGGKARQLPLEHFGAYRALRVLGEGGMGVVYLAERADLGSLAAVKILRDAALSPARRERFAAEQRTLAQLHHPSIARLYDADTLPDGTPWFVMEYVDGVPITEHCTARACSVDECLRLFRAVCEAVQHAHQHAIIHRDLKPSNILVREPGPAEAGQGSVCLLDFGIAKQLETAEGPAPDQTRTGLRLMTPAYAAPEQLRGERVGVQTDVYALGVVLYELLAGRLPFDLSRHTPESAAEHIAREAPERPSAAVRRTAAPGGGGARFQGVSRMAWADLDVLCLTAMHPDPARRYRSVEALMRDVDHYLRGEPLEARPDSARYRARKFARRNARPLAVAGAVFALVVALVAFYTFRLAAARTAAVAEAARAQRIQRFTLNLFVGGDDEEGPADSLRVVTLLDRGVREAAGLASEPAAQAELYYTLGTIFQKLGRLDRADTLLRAALDRRRALFGAENRDVATNLVALGLLRGDQARFDEAERLVRDGLAMTRRLQVGGDDRDVATATSGLGLVLETHGQFPQAIPVLEEAARLQSTTPERERDLALTLKALADAHFGAGHLAAADSLFRRILVMDRRHYGDRHPQVAAGLMNIGSVAFERGDYAAAERAYREGVAIDERWYGASHPTTANAITLLAQSLIKLSREGDAQPLLERALAIDEHVFGPTHPRVGLALNALGAVAAARGLQAEADDYYTRSAAILRAAYGPTHYLVGASLGNRASTWIERGDPERAERLLHEALAIYAKSLAPDHLYVGIARLKLGRALVRQKRWTDAERELRTGYDVVAKQAAPSSPWLTKAREDLAVTYRALGKPDEAARFQVPPAPAPAR